MAAARSEDNEVDQRVGAQAIGAVDGGNRAGSPTANQAGRHPSGIVRGVSARGGRNFPFHTLWRPFHSFFFYLTPGCWGSPQVNWSGCRPIL